MNAQNVRQGDVIIKAISSIPTGTKPVGGLILAHGEVTGHAHRVTGNAALLERDDKRYLKVTAKTTVTHEEHGTVSLEPGSYEIVIQREYEPDGWRAVFD